MTVIEYVEYVGSVLKKWNDDTTVINDQTNEITPLLVNTALANYQEILRMLIAEYQRAKMEVYEATKAYKKWYNIKFAAVKTAMQAQEKASGKTTIKLAVKEYDSEVERLYEEEYWEYQDKITIAESKMSTALQCLQGWQSQDKILVRLASNMQSEMYALSIESRINFDRDKIRVYPSRITN